MQLRYGLIPLKIVGYCFAIASIGLFIGSLISYLHARHFVDAATRAKGTIVELVERHSGDSGTSFYPVFIFHDSQEKERKIYSTLGTYPPAYKVGDKVTVLYDVNDPENASLEDFLSLWFIPLLLGGIGVAQLIVALVLIFSARFLGNALSSIDSAQGVLVQVALVQGNERGH